MTQIGWKPLLGLYLGVGGVSTLVLRWFQLRGTDPFPVPLSVIIVLVLIAGLVLCFGIRIRRWVRDGEHFDAVGATRTLALAQAASLVGAMQAGYFTSQIIIVYEALPAPDAWRVTLFGIAALVAAGVLIAAGLIAQWCCRVPPDEDDPTNQAPTG
ncbi:MAG TPA: DUF3180 domain-containing protein [Beutenbergiaceae bacterium]|nr:DUF3180 domain-containing protein [Beutenbergiaceae bacterium]